MKHVRSLSLLAIVLVASMLASCAPVSTPTAAPTQPTPAPAMTQPPAAAAGAALPAGWKAGWPTNGKDLKGKPIVIADVPKLIGIGYFTATSKGMQEAAKELGTVTVSTDAPTEAKIEKQIEFIDNFTTKGVDYIFFASNDAVAISPVLRKALSEGIGVVGYDNDSEENARQFFVNMARDQDVAYTMVDSLAAEAGEDAQVGLVTSSLTAPYQNALIAKIKERIGNQYPKMKLLDIRPSEEDQNLAFTVTQDLIKAYPTMNAVIGLSSVAFPGAADAVTQAGKCSTVHVIGLSTPNAMRKFVKAGCVQTVVLWNPVDLGYATVYAARALADGTLKPGDTELSAGKLGKLSITGSVILLGAPYKYTKDNIDNFDF